MLLIAVTVAGLALLGFLVVARVTHLAMRRLGLDAMTVLLFFGIAEAPRDELSARRLRPVGSGEPARAL